MHPDSATWATAPDRFEAVSWYRELGRAAGTTLRSRTPDRHPIALGIKGFHEHFAAHPTTLICPGDEWTDDALERALDLDLQLVSSYYLAIRDRERFCWAQHVCAPYLDDARAAWFDAGLPVVGYFHDADLALKGVDWLRGCLARWDDAGARHLIDLRALAAAVGRRLRLEDDGGTLTLTVTAGDAPDLVRSLKVGVSDPRGRLPHKLSVHIDGGATMLPVRHVGDGSGRVVLPRGAALPRRPAPSPASISRRKP
jgi:hypothetical protein